jgi:uncharacterized protein involved in exopolysaccharide biosynthesis
MASNNFNLVDIGNSINRRFRFILTISAVSAVIGGFVYVVGPKKYEAKTDFIIRNPLYSDRNYLYNYDTKFLDYFGNEDDGNRIMVFAQSELVQRQIIRNMGLAKAYKYDTTKPKQEFQLIHKFDKNLSVMRMENRDLMLSYTDTDPKRAAAVANESVRVLEDTYEDFYNDMRKGMHLSILNKIVEEDSMINSLTDTLAKLREKYGIYDIISPARHNLMNGSMRESSKKNYGLGIELVQNIESLKDEMVADRAVKTTLANQYTTSYTKIKMPIIKVITEATPPVTPKGLGGLVTMIACGFLGFVCCTLFVAVSDGVSDRKGGK